MSPDPNRPHETCQEPAGLQHRGCTCVWPLPEPQSIPQTSQVASLLPPSSRLPSPPCLLQTHPQARDCGSKPQVGPQRRNPGFDTWSVAHLCCAQVCCHVVSLAKELARRLRGRASAKDSHAVTCAHSQAQEQSTPPSCSPSSDVPPPPLVFWGSKSFNTE